jgi:hypothetical protein
MNGKTKNKLGKLLIILAAVCLAVSFVFVFIYTAEHEHECTHDDTCPVCHYINACLQMLEELSAAAESAMLASGLFLLSLTVGLCVLCLAADKESPIRLKTRLNN